MVNIYAASRGGILKIDGHGTATFEVPCDVPEYVADELCASGEFAREPAQQPALVTATDSPRAASVPQPQSVELAYHARRAAVHHVREDCPMGNNIEPQSRRKGDGGLPLCSECERLSAPESEA